MRDYADIISQIRIAAIGVKKQSNRLTLMQDAADAIEELLAAVPKWISVKERLSEIGKIVLVSDGDDIDAACRYKAFTIPDEVETFFWDSVIEVTHWMPMPEPPKEVE